MKAATITRSTNHNLSWRILGSISGLLLLLLMGCLSGAAQSSLASAHSTSDTPPTTPACQPAWSLINSPNPGSYSNYLEAVTAISTSDVWAVGEYDTGGMHQTLAEHHRGVRFDREDAGSNTSGISSGVYQTLIEHWDGTSWSVIPSPNVGTNDNELYGVAAVSSNDIWAV